MAETRTAGDDRIISEVTSQGGEKMLYKLKIDEATLNKRNVSPQPTAYGKKLMLESKRTKVSNITTEKIIKTDEAFQAEFEN